MARLRRSPVDLGNTPEEDGLFSILFLIKSNGSPDNGPNKIILSLVQVIAAEGVLLLACGSLPCHPDTGTASLRILSRFPFF